MSHAQRLRTSDVRDVYTLLGECRELGADPKLWRLHFSQGACRLVRAQVGIIVQAKIGPDGIAKVIGSIDHGWASGAQRSRFLAWVAEQGLESDPLAARIGHTNARNITRDRRQVIPDAQWYEGAHYREVRRPAGTDHCILSFGPISGRPELHSLCVNRPVGDRPFTYRQRAIIHLCQSEACRLIGMSLSSFEAPSIVDLSPRQRQTAEALMSGQSEKEIAHRLALSPTTIHEYIAAVYRHYGVSSRAELMAHWIARKLPQ